MRKIIIADDDAAIRISLKTMVNWEMYGWHIAGEAADGQEALSLCLQHEPDAVITDMKMPGTDGITFIRALRERGMAPHIIVLSGYDDFGLVRDAMKLGASDYILKLELNREKLLDALSEAGGKPENDPEEERLPLNRTILQQHLLREVICHFYDEQEECLAGMEKAGIIFPDRTVYCFLIKAGELYRFEDADDEEAQTLQNAVRNVTEDILRDCMEGYYVPGKTGELFVFSYLKEAYAGMDELPCQLAGHLKDMLYRFLDITCTICISTGGSSPDELYKAAGQVQELMKQRFFFEETGVLRCDRLPVRRSRPAEWGFIQLRIQITGTHAYDTSRYLFGAIPQEHTEILL